MMYKKVVVDDLILGIGTVKRNGNITKKEYDRLAKIIHNKILQIQQELLGKLYLNLKTEIAYYLVKQSTIYS